MDRLNDTSQNPRGQAFPLSHFAEEESEAQRRHTTCLRSLSRGMV